MDLTLGILLEILEDWMHKNKNQNKIKAHFIDSEETIEVAIGGAYHLSEQNTMLLVTKRLNEEDIYDDDGILLNDESPSGLNRQVIKAEHENLGNHTKIGIEIWFSDGDDDIQYRVDCHEYEINDQMLILKHFLNRDIDEYSFEFNRFLKSQY